MTMKKWIAHRGNNNHGHAENTKEALLASLATDYIAGIELDVRKTKDNQLVIIHNPTITWTSNGNGIVKYMNLKELEQYNFGTEKHPSKICTLNDLLKEIQSQKVIMIEAKENDIGELLYHTIQNYTRLNLYICSFDYDFVISFKKKYPNYKVGLIMGDMINHNRNTSTLDFISTKDIHKKTSQEIFYWGIDKKTLEQVDSNATIITDNAYRFKEEG